MDILDYQDFGKLRFSQFLIGEMEVDKIVDWEFMDRRWVGETINFSQFLRPADCPTVLACISLDLNAQPRKVWDAILTKVGLPLQYGMRAEECAQALGVSGRPIFARGVRRTSEFVLKSTARYVVLGTFDAEDGLVHVTVVRLDYYK